MKRSLTVLVCGFCLMGGALADESVVDKTKSAIERGAEATVHGVKRGVEAAGHGIEVGLSAAGRGIKRGAEATSRAMHKVVDKLSPSSDNTSTNESAPSDANTARR
ncbi:MAG: hypothetical protein HYU74_10735 [Dechloromonas sp.]|nr:hypothetical protein [Dechloromonas sp.]